MRYSIIGSGIAGITAAKTIRQYDTESTVTVFTNEFHPVGFYGRKDMLRQFSVNFKNTDDFLLDTHEQLEAQGIELIYHAELRVFPRLRQILKPHNIRQTYDRLLIATGATPMIVDAPGTHYIGVHQIRNGEDMLILNAWLPQLQQVGAAVIGGGVLGLELAHTLAIRDVPVTLIVRENRVGAPLLSEKAARLIENRLREDGVNLILGQTLTAYLSNDDKMLDGVQLSDGRLITARAAICAIGVRPNSDLAEDTDIDVDEVSGAIVVNEFMQTSVADVFAAGNCAMVDGQVSRNWATAAEQGRIAALNMIGQNIPYQPVFGDLDTVLYDLPFAYFGEITPVDGVTTWEWTDNASAYMQVHLKNYQVAGALLIGQPAAYAKELQERQQNNIETTVSDVEKLLMVAAR
jgi:NAD(P)H-nitrite reductase large subunit